MLFFTSQIDGAVCSIFFSVLSGRTTGSDKTSALLGTFFAASDFRPPGTFGFLHRKTWSGYSCPALRRLLCQCGNAENRLLLSACQSRLLCLRYTKNELRQSFSFANLHKVYCIILMEESPAGLHEDIFICLDIFRSIVHTITKKSIPLEAWLTFPSATDIHSITSLGRLFPCSCPSIRKLLTSHKIQRS